MYVCMYVCMYVGMYVSDNISNIEVNGAFRINMIVHNLLTQTRNCLKHWIYASYVTH